MGLCDAAVRVDWQALATLVTGFLAVGAAVYVGRQQLAIQKKQTELQELQVNTQYLAFKADLFERRFSVYNDVAAFISQIVCYDEPPRSHYENDFQIAWNEAKFLFCADTLAGIEEIWKRACDFSAITTEMKHTYATQGHYGDGNPDKKAQAFNWFANRLRTLPDLFPELKLGSAEL